VAEDVFRLDETTADMADYSSAQLEQFPFLISLSCGYTSDDSDLGLRIWNLVKAICIFRYQTTDTYMCGVNVTYL
jgi:hypothetical protein